MTNLREILLSKVVYSKQFAAFFLLAIGMIITQSLFHIDGVVNGPQFGAEVNPDLVRELVDGNNGNMYLKMGYYGFFILDFIWAFFLLLIAWKFFYKQRSMNPERFPSWLFYLFTVLCIGAYLSDMLENSHYLINKAYYHPFYLSKIIAYSGVFLIFGYTFLRTVVKKTLGTLWRFLRSSVYSILILLVLGFFLPRASQVNSIVVELYLEPINLLLLLLLAPTFAIALTHYPSYFNIDEDKRDWFISKLKLFGLFGVVHYRFKEEFRSERTSQREGTYNILLRMLGVCFYSALFFMIGYASEVNFNWLMQTEHLAVILFAIGAVLLYQVSSRKDQWYDYTYDYLLEKLPNFADNDYTPDENRLAYLPSKRNEDEQEASYMEEPNDQKWQQKLKLIHQPVKRYFLILLIAIIAHIVLFGLLWSIPEEAANYRYNEALVILSLVCVFLQTLTFAYFRAVRSLLRFTCYSPHMPGSALAFVRKTDALELQRFDASEKQRLIEGDERQVHSFFAQHPCRMSGGLFNLFTYLGFGRLSSNTGYLWFNSLVGVGIFGLLVYLNINTQGAITRIQEYLPGAEVLVVDNSFKAIGINTVLIILLYLFNYYGLLVALTKNYIYYRYARSKKSIRFVNALAGTAAVLLVLNIITRSIGNDIFSLRPIEAIEAEQLSLEEYKASLVETDQTRFYIGAYGGGMKANAWTLTVLNQLQQEDNRFLGHTVGISGVSGGTMGLMNLSAIASSHFNAPNDWEYYIHEVATENILSMDINQMLGRDTFYYLFNPLKWEVSNRSEKAMERYAILTENGPAFYQRKGYREFWKSLYDREVALENNYPILIANTTNVAGNQGMAVSVKVEDPEARKILYRGADDILEIRDFRMNPQPSRPSLTLSYYDAASTSNRFPLLSPAALIETKGNFNDGGIFENSGLLSVYKLFEAIQHKEKVKELDSLKQKNVFINVVNDKNLYIRFVIDRLLQCEAKEVNSYSELSSLLSSVAATEMLPTYIKSELSRLDAKHDRIGFYTLYLPHNFSVAEVKALYGKTLYCQNSGDPIPQDEIDAQLLQISMANNKEIRRIIEKYDDRYWGDVPVIEPAVSRLMSERAYEYMIHMLEHPIVEGTIEEIMDEMNR